MKVEAIYFSLTPFCPSLSMAKSSWSFLPPPFQVTPSLSHSNKLQIGFHCFSSDHCTHHCQVNFPEAQSLLCHSPESCLPPHCLWLYILQAGPGYFTTLCYHPLISSSTHKPRPPSKITSQTLTTLLSVWAQMCSSLKYPPLLPLPARGSLAQLSRSFWRCSCLLLVFWPPGLGLSSLFSDTHGTLSDPSYSIFIFLCVWLMALVLGSLKLIFITLHHNSVTVSCI